MGLSGLLGAFGALFRIWEFRSLILGMFPKKKKDEGEKPGEESEAVVVDDGLATREVEVQAMPEAPPTTEAPPTAVAAELPEAKEQSPPSHAEQPVPDNGEAKGKKDGCVMQ